MADKVIYWSKTALTGGAATALDSIDGAALQDGEIAHVWISNVLYIYLLDVDSGAAESSPAIIAPDTNPGDKRWILQSYYSGSGTLYTDHIAESTAAHGVEIDGLTIKDSGFALGSDADGDMYYRASGALARLAKGTSQYILRSTGTAPEWALNNAIQGDGTAGRVLRVSLVRIEDGANANTIKITMTSTWNGDTVSAKDNLGKGGTVAPWTLNAAGTVLTLDMSTLSGAAVVVPAVTTYYNLSGTAMDVYGQISSGNILFNFYNSATGAPLDMTALMDTSKQINLIVMYITSA